MEQLGHFPRIIPEIPEPIKCEKLYKFKIPILRFRQAILFEIE